MKSTKEILLLIVLVAFSFHVSAQSDIRSYSLKRGQAFDIILLNINSEAKDLMNNYFEVASPIAKEEGYMPQKGYAIKNRPTQGNYWPQVMIFGIWKDYDKRVQFVTDITESVPDFHEMRREIWPTFNLTYWKVNEDKDFSINQEKFNVVTAYWSQDSFFEEFNKKWLKEVKKSGGKITLELSDGTSPFGYNYDPDYLTITEWESKEAFDAFNEKNELMDHKGVKHVNQFAISY